MSKEVPPPLGAHCHTMRKAEDAARITMSKESLAGEWIQSPSRYKIHSYTRTIPDVTQTIEGTYVIIDEEETVFIMRASVLTLAKFWHQYNVRNSWVANLQSVDISCNGSSWIFLLTKSCDLWCDRTPRTLPCVVLDFILFRRDK